MAAPTGFKFRLDSITHNTATGANNMYRQLALSSISNLLKISGWKIYATASATVNDTAQSTSNATVRLQLWYKINNNSAVALINHAETFRYNNVNGKVISTESTGNIDLTGANYLRFRFRAAGSEGSVGAKISSTCTIYLVYQFTTETTITAAKVNQLNAALNASASATAGSAILRTPYQSLAGATNAPFNMDNVSPLATNLSSLITKANDVTKYLSLTTITEAQYGATL